MEFQKIVSFLDIISDDKSFPKFVSMINQEEIIAQIKKLESKHQC